MSQLDYTQSIHEVSDWTSGPIKMPITGTDRAVIAHTLLHWFEAANKRPCPDLDQKCIQFKKSLAKLALSIELSYQNGQLTATALGEDLDTLNKVRAGTLWFNGWDHVEARLLTVVQDSV